MRKTITILICLLAFQLSAQESAVVKIEFEGLKRTKESFLRRLIKTKVNEKYDKAKVDLDIERLNRLAGVA